MYSNCLIEAIKAKIKDPENVQIIKLPKVATTRGHYGWTDGEYFYHSYNTNRKWYNKWWHPSKTKKVDIITFESFILGFIRYSSISYKKKIIKKLHLHIGDFISNSWEVSFPKTRNKLPKAEDVEYLKKVHRAPVFFKVSKNNKPEFVTYEQLVKIEGVFRWKWVSILDEDFENLFSKMETAKVDELL